jgi:murein DD-endopeptidase MepM/ murein hydrolase activator NlpD
MRRFRAAGTFAVGMLLMPTDFAGWMDRPVSAGALRSARLAEPLRVIRGTIARNSNLGLALSSVLSPTAVHQLVESARPVYDLKYLSVGHPFDLTLGPNGLLSNFSYSIDALNTLRVTRNKERLTAEVLTRTYETRVETAAGEIETSLFGAVADAGESDQLALDLADIFAWDIDFNTELQRGDSFRVAVEKLYLDGEFQRYGRVLAAEFVRGNRTLQAIRFEGERAGYYTPDGEPMRKAFLRSPLRFTRISSIFTTHRFHPILHQVRPHYGVDYAAPIGTPVMAAGNGMVRLAGRSGGYGNTVRIRHPNGYETLYGHLSRMSVRAGDHVTQGQMIGAVGMTGLATGPHLDYRMLKNGGFVNPLTLQSPPAEPLSPAELAAFQSVRDQRLALLQTARPPVVIVAAR